MSDNIAIQRGYTEAIEGHSDDYDLCLLVKPGTDFDRIFKAWDIDAQEFLVVHG